MQTNEPFCRNTLSICWLILIQIIITMFLVSVLHGAIANDFTGFAAHPGHFGVNAAVLTIITYAFLALSERVNKLYISSL